MKTNDCRKSIKTKTADPSSSWPEVYRWLATGALVAYSAIGPRTVIPARAQQAPDGGDAVSSEMALRRYDIPAGPLDAVLGSFESASGLHVELASEKMRSLSAKGVSGMLTTRQALEQLLADTGVSWRFSGPDTVTLELEAMVTSVEVSAKAEPTNPRYTEPLLNIPQTIVVIPRAVLEQQGATNLADALKNVPGLTMAAGEGGQPAGDNMTLRGFSARNDVFVDGVRDLGPQSRDPFNMEQVEVIKGPNSAISGRGSTGGAVNMVSKWPGLQRFFTGNVQLGTAGLQRFTGDVNLPFKDRYAFRTSFVVHDSGTPGRQEAVQNNRWGLAPSLALGLGTPTRLTLGYFKLNQNNISDYGIPWVPASNEALADYHDQPAPVPRDTFYGYANRDHEDMGADNATVRLEHSFSESVSFRNQFRYGRTTRDSIATPPRFDSPDTTLIRREMRAWLTKDSIYDNQADLIASGKFAGLRHSFVGGFNLTHERDIRGLRSAANALTTMLNPNPYDTYSGDITVSPDRGDVTANTQALYAFDTVHLGQRWLASGGLRWERFAASGIATNQTQLDQVDSMLSGRAGLTFKPLPTGSIYASYGTALNPSLEGLSYGTSTNALNLDPEKSYTLEFGTKWDSFRNRLTLSGALFRVDKTNARTPGVLPDDPPLVLEGKQRVSGVELGATGSLTSHWSVFSALSFLNDEIVESNNPNEVGNHLPQTPDKAFSLWTTYALPWRITVGGGARYVGRRYNNTSNTRSVDGHWTVDAMLGFPVTKHLEIRLNAYNLGDVYYFERVRGGHVVPGYGRALAVSTSFQF